MLAWLAPLKGQLAFGFSHSLDSLKAASELLYRFGEYSLDTELLELRHRDAERKVEPQILSLLTYLIENKDRVISKDEIFEHVWEGRIVSDATLHTRINGLRRAIGDNGQKQDKIRTFARRGFRFVADLVETSKDTLSEEIPARKSTSDENYSNKPTIAVLPFANMSGDPEQQYFSDGLTDDIISGLSRSWNLAVIARTSTMSYANKPTDVRQIGQDLNTQYVLEGSVRRSGNRIRISAQLIAASSGIQIWGNKYDRNMLDIFDIQDEITENIGGAVDAEIYRSELEQIRKRPRVFGVYDLELKASWHLTHLSEDDNRTCQDYCHKALLLDDQRAPAYSILANSYTMDAVFGWGEGTRAEAMIAAISAAKRAIKIDPNYEIAHFVLSMALLHQGEHDKAIREAELTVEINPSFYSGHHMLAFVLGYSCSGSLDRIMHHMNISRRLAPRHPFLAHNLSVWSIVMTLYGQIDKAVEFSEEAMILGPSLSLAVRAHASALAARGEISQAEEVFAEHDTIDPDFDWAAWKSSQLIGIKGVEQRDRYFKGLRLAGARF